MKEGPERIKNAIRGLSKEELFSLVIPGKWTIAEIIIHLADGETVGACRFRQALAGHPRELASYNEAEWAEKLNYGGQSLETIYMYLDLFTLLRKTSSILFHQCRNEDWLKSGLHPERGKMNLRSLLELYADHSERHLEQILERRKLLGNPLQMDLILKTRLY